jgi:DNA-binding NtrC family response regulator
LFTNSTEALNSFKKDEYDLVLLDSKIPNLKEMSLYKKFKEIDNKVSICFTNADMESIQEIKQQALQFDNNNNNTICKSFSLNDQTKIDILLLNDKDTILIKS